MKALDFLVCLSPAFMGVAVGTVYGLGEGIVTAVAFGAVSLWYLFATAGEDEWDE